MKRTLLKVLQSSWHGLGVMFPTNQDVVIFHSISVKEHNALASHAGLLFKNQGKYVYIEKAGSSGPYVRIDFMDMSDLFSWYKAAIKQPADKGNPLFATFNDQKIESLDEPEH
jgi:hypothetical protein